ncbi:cell number regulator 13-like isoform X3 [Malus domestica]|uniref:cell number regulator 13-like isoform X3 n=1 Tax=Malus domestica TaxID=3750 RepID=UPI003974AD70
MASSDFAEAPGLDAVGLTSTIVSTAQSARTHRHNCQQLAEHVRMVGNLLEKMKSTDLMKLPCTKEPLDGLEKALVKALLLVQGCRDNSCLYMFALGWSVVYQFRQVQAEIDHYVGLLVRPLVSLLQEFRLQNLKEGLEAIEEDQRLYTLDEQDMEVHGVVLKPDRTTKDADILERALSRKYPNMAFDEALQEEKEKLNIELQRAITINDPDQCRVIEHLIHVAENVVSGVLPGKKVEKLLVNEPSYVVSGYVVFEGLRVHQPITSPGFQLENEGRGEWQAELFGCCSEPCLSEFLRPVNPRSKRSSSLFEVPCLNRPEDLHLPLWNIFMDSQCGVKRKNM